MDSQDKLLKELGPILDRMDKKDSTEEYGHPAKLWPSRWFFHDRSDQSVEFQTMDIVNDIRTIVLVWFVLWVIF